MKVRIDHTYHLQKLKTLTKRLAEVFLKQEVVPKKKKKITVKTYETIKKKEIMIN